MGKEPLASGVKCKKWLTVDNNVDRCGKFYEKILIKWLKVVDSGKKICYYILAHIKRGYAYVLWSSRSSARRKK